MHKFLVVALILIVSGVGLAGCSFAPRADVAAAADYGSAMTDAEMKSAADKWLTRVLKDPESRRVEWGQSGRVWAWKGLFGGGNKYGYGIEALVNAKNSFGGYVGAAPYFFLFRDGQLVGGTKVFDRSMYGFVK